jgi:hypothetical protein
VPQRFTRAEFSVVLAFIALFIAWVIAGVTLVTPDAAIIADSCVTSEKYNYDGFYTCRALSYFK